MANTIFKVPDQGGSYAYWHLKDDGHVYAESIYGRVFHRDWMDSKKEEILNQYRLEQETKRIQEYVSSIEKTETAEQTIITEQQDGKTNKGKIIIAGAALAGLAAVLIGGHK